MDLTDFEIIDEPDKNEACKKSVKLVHDGKASMPMKGIVDTPIILKAVLNSDFGLKSGRLLSHVGVLSIPGFSRLLIQSDAAINIVPSFREKIDIINNAVSVAHALGNELPKVALLCAVEKVNPKMQATIDAEELTRLNEIGEIKECLVKGPLALDNAISIEAAKHKGISHPVAGNADILITPNIEAGNILNKTLEHFCKAEKAGIIIGANVPIILTSRAASKESKLNSIALGVLISHK
jgi:phosphate butyryltransferase